MFAEGGTSLEITKLKLIGWFVVTSNHSVTNSDEASPTHKPVPLQLVPLAVSVMASNPKT